jgi:transcriptional regulator GlxA family with amidase domain
MGTNNARKKIAAVLYPGSVSLDLVGPLEAFNYANQISEEETGDTNIGYDIELLAAHEGPVESMSGVRLCADKSFIDYQEPISILLVPGMRAKETRYQEHGLIQWITHQAKLSERIMSVCSGAIVLAHAGILSGKKVTTHWNSGDIIRNQFPNIEVDDSRIYCKSDNIYSSAGVTAGIDLALAIISEDFGRPLALKIAKRMVVFLQRPGDQSQFSDLLSAQGKSKRFTALLDWIELNLNREINIAVLAEKCAMSERNFARSFKIDIGFSPMQYIARRRLEGAKLLLEEGTQSLESVARINGFVTLSRFSKAFKEVFHTTPGQYRKRFR